MIDTLSYGLRTDRNRGENWVLNERVMHSICSEMGIQFVGILQPYLFSDRECDIYHEYVFDRMNKKELEETKLFYSYVKELIKDYPFILDMTDAFFQEEGIYKDYCHMLERGNILLANKIYRELRENDFI